MMRGCLAAILNRAMAGPSGVLRPCSQLRSVWTCVSFVVRPNEAAGKPTLARTSMRRSWRSAIAREC